MEITPEVISQFMTGRDEQKYIVAIEAAYNDNLAYVVVNDPDKGKYIERFKYKPFLWMKEEVGHMLYDGNKAKLRAAMQKYGITIKKLRTANAEGVTPSRMDKGFKYLVTCSESNSKLNWFFKEGGFNPREGDNSKLIFKFAPDEQFMIQTGKRLFKGFEDYDDLHRLQFDLETQGLDPMGNPIFQIGIRDNRGYERIIEVVGDTPQELRDAERVAIVEFFKVIDDIQPDIIAGYNSANFDWPFLYKRSDRLSVDITKFVKGLDGETPIKDSDWNLKMGQETERYSQTLLWGYNVLDISHSVRRAQAINSSIKSWSLKYITKFSKAQKPNRVYIDGDKIYTTWKDTENVYYFNEDNGDWFKHVDGSLEQEELVSTGDYDEVKGAYIVERYLLDDLWETEKIDNIYNQAPFLLAKSIPTSYMRSSTMGTAGQWSLMLAAWSYEHGLAIPDYEKKREFTGGLSRLLETGFAEEVGKLDYAALYPKTTLTYGIFPDTDISGVFKGLLTYIVDNRDKYKFLVEEYKEKVAELSKLEPTEENKVIIEKYSKMASDYDKKQLPLKILANSFYGAYGAPYIFPWGDTMCAEKITCMSRQHLRLMVRTFTEKWGFRALVGDSVTYDTPIYIKYKNTGYIDILPICDLFNENSEYLDIEKLRDFEEKPFDVLTRNGWTGVNYVYRHETDKKIHRVTTKNRLVNVTQDHSLFQNGVEVKPSELSRFDKVDIYDIPKNNLSTDLTVGKAYLFGFFLGDGSAICSPRGRKYISRKTGVTKYHKSVRYDWKISNTRVNILEDLQKILKDEFMLDGNIKNHMKSSSVYNLTVHKSTFSKYFHDNFYTSYREKKVPSIILNSTPDIKKAFINGVFASDGYGDTIEDCSDIGMKSQVAMAGISLILKELGIDYKIVVRKDKQAFINFKLKNHNRNNSSFTNKTKMKCDEVWNNYVIDNKDLANRVYDISTEDGTFICGIGGIIAHNTDGFNFAIPDNVNDFKYTPLGNHWKTTKYKGIELCGLDACLAYFNENYMEGWMGLDVDDVCKATINFKRKNYANLIGTKVKFVGNSIKSKAMPTYIEDFLDKGIKLLLDGKGYDFINYYYEYIEDIYNYRIPLVKIASKAKVKQTVSQYIEDCKTRTKSGSLKARKAHMELILHHDMSPKLGDVIYYVNTAETKSKGDVQMVKDRKTKENKIVINCKLISQEDIENNPNYITDEYNVHKYIDAFNTRIAPLLVVFSKDIRGKILLDMVKDKKTKQYQLQDRYYFTESECKLVSGQPLEDSDQDTYEQLMTMENKEIRFWMMANEVPNRLTIDEWDTVKQDYFNRKADGLKHDLDVLKSVCVKLELNQLKSITNNGKLPTVVSDVVRMDEAGNLISKEWAEPIADLSIVFDYMDMAKFRDKFYKKFNITGTKKYDKWLKFVNAAKIPDTFTLDDYVSLFTDISEYTLKELMNLDNGILNTLMSRRVKEVEPINVITETPIVLSGDLMTDMFVFMNEVESL